MEGPDEEPETRGRGTELAVRGDRDLPSVSRSQSLSSLIESRLADATDPREFAFYYEMAKDARREEAEERLQLAVLDAQKRQQWFKFGYCGGTFITGTALVIAGFPFAGFFMAGGSLAMVVPDYVKQFLNSMKKNENSDE